MDWMLKNSSNETDGSFTFAAISFLVTTFCVLLSCFDSLTIGSVVLRFKGADNTLLLGYLTAAFSTYVVRRTTKDIATTSPNT